MPRERLILQHRWALGDTVLMTGLVRDLELAYPGRYEIVVDTHWTPVWWHNPRCRQYRQGDRGQRIKISWRDAQLWHSYARFDKRKAMRHILAWYHYDFEQQTGIPVPVTAPRGELFLSPQEREPILEGRYWVVMGGGKLDITNKHWPADRYQAVVDRLREYGLRFVQCGATHKGHVHRPLENCLNLIGKTDNVRDFFNLVLHADGVICPVTAAMHIAAAFEKPCVVIAGGREEPWFAWYGNGFEAFGPGCPPVAVPHKFLHTLGLQYCCDDVGCWRRKTVPLSPSDRAKHPDTMCLEPIRLDDGRAFAGCMHRIQIDHVARAVMDYFDEKILPPVGEPRPLPPREPVVDELPAAMFAEPRVTRAFQKTTQQSAYQTVVPPELPRNPPAAPPRGRRAAAVPPLTSRPAAVAPTRAATRISIPLLDHPIIGGKLTVCLLCYGPYTDLAKRCLDGILETLPRDRIDLRIGTNEAAAATVEYLKAQRPDRLYIHAENAKKYPVMREMFWDPAAPLRTRYLVWFDDDTWIVDPLWASRLCETIVANHKQGCRLYGAKLFHDLSIYTRKGQQPQRWFQQASWYRGASFRVRGSERVAPNGSCLDFVSGWFWALGTDAIRAAGIPDERLNHNGGDITIGAQVTQAGFRIKEFNKGKTLVACPPKDHGGRRGYSETFPWANEIR